MALYDELGGAAGVSTAVWDSSIRRCSADPTLSPFFDGVDLEDLAKRIGSFMAMATGGPADYQGPRRCVRCTGAWRSTTRSSMSS